MAWYQMLAEDSPPYTTVKKQAAEFMQDRGSTEYDSRSVRSKPQSLTNKGMPFMVWFSMTDI